MEWDREGLEEKLGWERGHTDSSLSTMSKVEENDESDDTEGTGDDICDICKGAASANCEDTTNWIHANRGSGWVDGDTGEN